MTPVEARKQLAVERVLKNLEGRGFVSAYAPTKADALRMALAWIPDGSSVGWGGSATLDEIGLKDAVRQGNYIPIDRETAKDPAERKAIMKQALTADVFLMSTNALSEDGQLVNIDGVGNRVAALCFGPDKVIIVAGYNKLVHTLDDAVSRARHYAAPVNGQRFALGNPCNSTGICAECHKPSSYCSQLVITRTSMVPGRIHVLLVGEELGY